MKLKIYSITKISKGDMELPSQFNELIRPDLIKKVVRIMQFNKRQKYGSDPEAGKRASAELSRRRRKYRGSYGIGISRVPRKIVSRRGTRMNWIGAFAPGTVGGRRAHPPKAEKEWTLKINKKERRKAIRSAMAANIVKELVAGRGHVIPETYPFILEDKIESLSKTKEAIAALKKLDLGKELERTSESKIRAGKGKLRGRKYVKKKGPLIVVSGKCGLINSCKNIPGVDVVEVDTLNAEVLAPGASIGRLTLYTENAVKRIKEENLFTNNPARKFEIKEKKPEKEKIEKKPEPKLSKAQLGPNSAKQNFGEKKAKKKTSEVKKTKKKAE